MAYEIKELKGSLFLNENKETDNQPDYTGKIKINDKVWRIAAWITESSSGSEYLSLSISDPEKFRHQQQGQTPRAPLKRLSDEEFQRRRQERAKHNPPRPNPEFDFDDEDLPF